MSSSRTILEVQAAIAKFTRGLDEMGCYRMPKFVAPVVVFFDARAILRLANQTSLQTQLELPRYQLISKYAEDLANPSSLTLYTPIANGCVVEYIEMIEIGDTVYPIYLATGRVQVSGHCVNLTHSSPGCFTTCKGTRITMGPVAAALFNPRG